MVLCLKNMFFILVFEYFGNSAGEKEGVIFLSALWPSRYLPFISSNYSFSSNLVKAV